MTSMRVALLVYCGAWLLILGAIVAPLSAHADSLAGEVVAIVDGDTLTVLDSSKVQHKIRLAGIDAPEKRQAFGGKARESLGALTFNRSAVVEFKKRDRYGRLVGKVLVGGIDVGLQQVRAGLAWHYKDYAREQAPSDRSSYAAAEIEARSAGRGLWVDREPTPPWDFRHRQSKRPP